MFIKYVFFVMYGQLRIKSIFAAVTENSDQEIDNKQHLKEFISSSHCPKKEGLCNGKLQFLCTVCHSAVF